jgi:hypothetical protein
MARPSAASLNSLAEVLRQAQPLYSECRLILNYLGHSAEMGLPPLPEESGIDPDCNPANKDAASQSLTVFELRMRYGKEIV